MCFHHPVCCKLHFANYSKLISTFLRRFPETGSVLIMRILFPRGAWDVSLPHWVAQNQEVWPRTSRLHSCACLTPPNGFLVHSNTSEKRLNSEMIQRDLSNIWADEIPVQQCTCLHLQNSSPVWMKWKKLKASSGRTLDLSDVPAKRWALWMAFLKASLPEWGELFGQNKWSVTFWPPGWWALPLARVVPFQGGSRQSNKRQASSRLVISWEAGTPLLPNWHCRAANKGFLRDGKQAVSTLRCGDCRLSAVGPKEKTRRRCPGEHLTH